MSPTTKTELTIRCALTRQSAWRTLNTPGSKITSKITSLEITPDASGLSEALTMPELVPAGTPADAVKSITTDKEATTALETEMLEALAKMTSLRHFTWRRDPGPLLGQQLWETLGKLGVRSLTVIDTKKSYFAEDASDLEFTSVLETPSFLALTGLTSLELTTYRVDGLAPEDDQNHVAALEDFLTANSKTLEVLHLKLGSPGRAVNVSGFVARLKLPKIREASFHRMATTAQGLISFSQHNLSIVSLSLGPMITGRRWEEIQISENFYPNLQHLDCTAFQLAMILEHRAPNRPLWCITGIDVRETVVPNEYFGDLPDSWENAEDVDKYEDAQRGKPLWRDELLPRLKGQPITHLRLRYIDGPQDLDTLAELLPGVRWLDMGKCTNKISWNQWAQSLSKFKELRVLHGNGCGLHILTKPGPKGEPVKVLEENVAAALRIIALACPKLEAYEDWTDSVRIRRDGAQITFDPIKDIDVKEGEEGLLFPSRTFVQATIRKEGGPNQPGPNVRDVFAPA